MKASWMFYTLNLNKLKEEDGFTLLEVLIALSISSLCFTLLAVGINQAKMIRRQVERDPQIDWHIFLNQLEFYLEESEFVSLTEERLEVREKNREDHTFSRFIYETYQPRGSTEWMIRRRGGDGGHQPMLFDLEEVQFSTHGKWLVIEAYFKTGEKYRASLVIHSWEEEEI